MKLKAIPRVFTAIGVLHLAFPAQAIMEPISVASDDKFPSLRYVYGLGETPKDPLALMKKAQIEGDAETCVKQAGAARAKAKNLGAWITQAEIECASKLKVSAANMNSLARALAIADKNPSWMLTGPQAPTLRQAVLKGYLVLLEADIKLNPARATKTISEVQELLPYSEDKMQATFWRWAGELAFQQRKFESARELFKRSLAEGEDSDVRARLALAESSLNPEKKPEAKPTATPAEVVRASPTPEGTKEELELVDSVTAALKAGELVNAVDDATKIIKNYPGSTRAKWAQDRVMEAYWSIAEKSDSKFVHLKSQMVKLMDRVDHDRQAEFARLMYNRGQWEDSLTMIRGALERITGTRATPLLDLAGKAAMANDKFDLAEDYFTKLVEQHAGQKESREAMLRLGLLAFRQGKYEKAQAHLEKLLALPQVGQYEAMANYWLWRSLQKQKSDRANAVADELLKKVPFSYYGIRARYERAANTLEWKPETPTKIASKFLLTPSEKKTWDRLQALLKAGWLDEAQAELKLLPNVEKAEDKALRSILWAAAGGYGTASRLANEAWDEKPELRRPPFVENAFPKEFTAFIDQQSSLRKVDRYLIKGLIKQESSYNARAKSSANALGLMQLVPPTARDMAQELKLGAVVIPDDLYDPKRNIQMGTYYISKMLNRYQGSVPMALAAYNAGPTRLDRWLKTRPSLKNVVASRSSAPEDELWFEEIPYWETSVYVKSILRNILIYKMLDQGRVQVGEPNWISTN